MSHKLSIRPYGLIAYNADRGHKLLQRHSMKMREKQTMDSGVLSENAARKLKTALKWLCIAAKVKKVYEKKHKRMVEYKVNMITLTFGVNLLDDKQGRQILNKWLSMAKYRFGLRNYVWKAETQERGAIHFHLVSDCFIPHKELRYTWNRLLIREKLGKPFANSTDVHAIVNVKNLVGYLVEYLCNEGKQAGRRKVRGRLWSCSQALSKAGKKFVLVKEDELRSIQNDLDKFHLRHRLPQAVAEKKEWLRFIDIWYLPEDWFDKLPECEIKSLFKAELKDLQPSREDTPPLF